MAYMLKYDNVHSRFAANIAASDDSFTMNGKNIKVAIKKCGPFGHCSQWFPLSWPRRFSFSLCFPFVEVCTP
jgi:hypothetical protein